MQSGQQINLPGCDVYLPDDWLFEQMAAPDQGWHIKDQDIDVWPTPGALDLLVIHAARAIVQQGGRLAVGVPRVVTGVALGPVIYTALNSLIQSSPSRASFPGFIRFPVESSECIVLASRSHALRDMFSESLVRFARQETMFCDFPTYRLARTGELIPAAFGRFSAKGPPRGYAKLQSTSSIVLYDFWPISQVLRVPRVAAVFAELAESDSFETVERLGDLLDRTHPRLTLAILNLNDIEKRRHLESLGFHFIAAQSTDMDSGASLLPSFRAIDTAVPKHVCFTYLPVTKGEAVETPLSEAFGLLAEIHSRVPSGMQYPKFLNRAWYILDHLAGCPVPIASYERCLRRDPRQQSLEFRLGKLGYVDWESVPASLRGSLMLGWPYVIEALQRAHASLAESNPKWWYLAERILDTAKPLAVLLPGRLEAQALRDEMLIEFQWTEYHSPVKIQSFTEARRNEERFSYILLSGNWKNWHRPLIYSVLPRSVEVLGYPFEACVLDKRLRTLKNDLEATLPDATRTTCMSLFDDHLVSQSAVAHSSLEWDSHVVHAARATSSEYWRRFRQGASEEVQDDDLLIELAAEVSERVSALMDDSAVSHEQVGTVTLSFADGTRLCVPADRELLVLPQGTEVTQQRFASEITAGDRVLVFSAGEQQDVFAATLARTRHLLKTDARILDRWHNALVMIRSLYPPEVRGMGVRCCHALEDLGCVRDRVTMRGWLRGSAMAPEEVSDIARLLQLTGMKEEAEDWAKLISKEMNLVRSFHRRIGRRIAHRMLRHNSGNAAHDRIDEEIDELLEDAELRTIVEVTEMVPQAKYEIIGGAEENET